MLIANCHATPSSCSGRGGRVAGGRAGTRRPLFQTTPPNWHLSRTLGIANRRWAIGNTHHYN